MLLRDEWPELNDWLERPDSTESHTGKVQELALVCELDRVDLKATSLVVGTDNRVYSERGGLISCLAQTTIGPDDPRVYVDSIKWGDFPPMPELAHLFEVFFSMYDREVLMLVGKNRDESGWLYFVPKQVGTCGLVEWDSNDDEMGQFLAAAKWIGTIHVHPGNSCTPSQTDIDDWADPTKSGLHLIFGRDGSYTINGAIAGRTFELEAGQIKDHTPRPVGYETSEGRPLKELLAVPLPPKVLVKGHKTSPIWKAGAPQVGLVPVVVTGPKKYSGSEEEFIAMGLECVDVYPLEYDDLDELYLLEAPRGCCILTKDQLEKLSGWCSGECAMPRVRKFSIVPSKGQSSGK